MESEKFLKEIDAVNVVISIKELKRAVNDLIIKNTEMQKRFNNELEEELLPTLQNQERVGENGYQQNQNEPSIDEQVNSVGVNSKLIF